MEDRPPLAAALDQAKETRFTGALILRRPGGESYTVTVHEGRPTRVYIGPDKIAPGTTLVPLDLVRPAMSCDVLSPEEQADAKARKRQTLRRLAWIEDLEGQCFEDPSLRVAPPTMPPPMFVEPRVGAGAAPTPTFLSGQFRRVSVPADWEARLAPIPTPGGAMRPMPLAPPPLAPPPPPPPPRDPNARPPLVRRVSVPEMQAVRLPSSSGMAAVTAPTDPASHLRLAKARASQKDFSGADRILREGVPVAGRDAEAAGFATWVRANLLSDLAPLIVEMDARVAADSKCQHSLYYRGLILKKSGERKAALRDFVTVVKQNPEHGPALLEIKDLRTNGVD